MAAMLNIMLLHVAGMFEDPDFATKAVVDKRGRKVGAAEYHQCIVYVLMSHAGS